MYRCDNCYNISQSREPMHRRVTETRPVTYTNPGEDGPRTSFGTEIVAEAQLCKACIGGTGSDDPKGAKSCPA